jgi:opacity protein-like surface antigen
LVTTDIDRGLVGQPFNFSLDLGVGLRYFVTRRWSINLEYRFQHISNADLGQRNIGINAQGPVLGISCFF